MKKITFCFIALLATFFNGQSQVELGDGNTIQKGVPFEPSVTYSYAQSIYLSSEILATGNIDALTWYYTGPFALEGSQELTIYLGHSAKTSFSSPSDWVPIANLTEVYSGGIYANGPGWVNIQLETPFEYNGTENLVIAVREASDLSDTWEESFYTYEVSENRSLSLSSWSGVPNLENLESGITESFVPNIIIGGITQTNHHRHYSLLAIKCRSYRRFRILYQYRKQRS